MYIYGTDYIKYLNDERAGRLTYDQWKYKTSKQDTIKCASCGIDKKRFLLCPRCKH